MVKGGSEILIDEKLNMEVVAQYKAWLFIIEEPRAEAFHETTAHRTQDNARCCSCHLPFTRQPSTLLKIFTDSFQLFEWVSPPSTNILSSFFTSFWAVFLPGYNSSPFCRNHSTLHHCERTYFKTISRTLMRNFPPITLHHYWCARDATHEMLWRTTKPPLFLDYELQLSGRLGVGGMLCCIWEAYTTLKAILMPCEPQGMTPSLRMSHLHRVSRQWVLTDHRLKGQGKGEENRS